MKKWLAVLVLISHMNFSMFIPQVNEIDQYDRKGRPVDDINTLSELIDQTVLGNVDKTPEDEDDDNGNFYHVTKIDDYCFTQTYLHIARPERSGSHFTFPDYKAPKLSTGFFEIQLPPPDAA